MNPPPAKGNNPERWEKFLNALDEKLQLGLLDHMRKIEVYHFEEDVLFIQPSSPEQTEYLKRETVIQQLQVLAQDAINVEKVKISTGINK